MTTHDRRRILGCGALALAWTTGCADPCIDDGLGQQGDDGTNCPSLDSDDATNGSDPSEDSADETAEPPDCGNGFQDGDETDVDCGGSCTEDCGNGQGCEGDDDCQSNECGAGMTCEDPTSCEDGIVNGDETDVDCGGGTCPPCDDGEICEVGSDCVSQVCDDGMTCVSPTCTDGVINGDETDVDCGGGTCPPCENGEMCNEGPDCESGNCDGGTCTGPSCRDGEQNGAETDVDCGGGECPPCDDGESCEINEDCNSQVCDPKIDVCLGRSCTDGVTNGDETDLDCGGACGATCDPGEGCEDGDDCLSHGCDQGGGTACNDFLAVEAEPSCSNYAGVPVPLVATATGGTGVYTYAWTPDDGTLSAPDQAMTDASPVGFQSYQVTVDDGFAMVQDSVVVVNSQPFDLQNNCTLYTADYGVSSSGDPATITYDMGGTRGCETGNNEFGLTLCETVEFQNTRLRGVVEVEATGEIPPDNDWVGLVWGAQDSSHFYSMIWKQSFQSGNNFNPPLPCDPPGGITVRRIDAPDFASLTGADFFCTPDTANSTLLLDPAATTTEGWVLDESYSVTIDFTDTGSTVTVVRDSDAFQIASFVVADTTYTAGYFGSTTASQVGACVGPLFAECL